LFQKLAAYNPLGSRDSDFKDYQKMSFLKKNLSECADEAVEEFALVMAKIYRWIQLVVDIRCEDVIKRRDAVEVAKQERENAIKLDNLRKDKYEKELTEKKVAFDEAVDAELAKVAAAAEAEKPEPVEGEEPKEEAEPAAVNRPEFDEREFKGEFDLNNPEIVIPAEVQDEVDNDYDLPYTAPTAVPE